MDSRHTSLTPEQEAQLVDQYIHQLLQDVECLPPPELDPTFAETIRAAAQGYPRNRLTSESRAALWRKVQFQAGLQQPATFTPNGKKKETTMIASAGLARPRLYHMPRPAAGLVTALTLILTVLLGSYLFTPLFSGQHAAVTPTPQPTASPDAFRYLMTQPVRSMIWSPDGQMLATIEGNSADQITLRDSAGKLRKTLIGHGGRINQLAWSPDGATLISAGTDKTVRVWTAAGDSTAILAQHTGNIDSVAWSPDGRSFASVSSTEGVIHIWSADDKIIRSLRFHPTSADGSTYLYWSPDGTMLAARYSDNGVDLWSADGALLVSLSAFEAMANGFAWSPDSTRFAIATVQNGLLIYSSRGKLELSLKTATTLVTPIWSPDGKRVAVYDFMNRVSVWNAADGALVGDRIFMDRITDLGFSPDSTLMTVSLDGSTPHVDILDRRLQTLNTLTGSPSQFGLIIAAWSPDGATLAGRFGEQPPQIFHPDVTNLVATSAASPVVTLPTSLPNAIATTSTSPEISLQQGQAVSGTLGANGQSPTYTVSTPRDGKLLVLIRSTDFAVNLDSQVLCNSGGGGSGGGGGGEERGSPIAKPFLIQVCGGGTVRLRVISLSGTGHGAYSLIAYPLETESFDFGKTVSGTISAQQPYHYYNLNAGLGDQLTIRFTPEAAGKILLTPDNLLMRVGDLTKAETLTTLFRDGGSAGLLITAADPGVNSTFTLRVEREPASVLNSEAKTLTLTAEQPVLAFRFTGNASPLLLKVRSVSGNSTATVSVQPVLTQGTPDPMASASQTETLLIEPQTSTSYKLNTDTNNDYVLFISVNGEEALKLEISLSTISGR